jgi:hypothetical protein
LGKWFRFGKGETQMARDIVARQLVYWAQVQAAGAAFDQQNGPGALTVANGGAGIHTVTMPANFTVPINRRAITLTIRAAVAAAIVYDEAGSAANTVVVRQFQGAQVATNTAYILEIARVEFAIGPSQG